MQKSKWILQTLILSGVLNAAFFGLFFYFLMWGNPIYFAFNPEGKEESCQGLPPLSPSLMGRLETFPLCQLVDLLQDDRKIEQGYRVRDFALGALAAFHDVDVERGLGKGSLAKRRWVWEENTFLLFPGLKEEDFDALITFAKKERYPFTPQGLFKRVKAAGPENCDLDLLQVLLHTPQVVLLETLFARTHLPIQKKTLLALALEGGWEVVDVFYKEQQAKADFTDRSRGRFLVRAIEQGSKTAAALLLHTDENFVLNEMDDNQVTTLLTLLGSQSEAGLKCAQKIALSPRGDAVRDLAFKMVVEKTGKIPPELAGHFYEKPGLKELRPVFRQAPPAAPDPRTHIVQPGESLWLIARKHHISLEKLVDYNHLQSTVIRPGKSLKIPPP